jgi:serine/threonine protein kinase/WD40 repeat protein
MDSIVPANTESLSSAQERELEATVAEFILACESGAKPDRQRLLQQHPRVADQLRLFFLQRDRLNQLAEPIRAFGDDVHRLVGPGQQISYVGNYELLEEVARGGMGVVYRARQTTLGRIVAVKMILSGRFATEQDVQRFQAEAQSAAALRHPNIVAIHEVGQHEGWHYFSMDFVEGRDLAAILRERPLPARKAAVYVRQIAEAIHYAHLHGTLHRDLKPSNVLIDDRDQVHITDFGLAIRVESDSALTRTGDVLGTPSYMPPEQAKGLRDLLGPTSDVYSIGAILYECLTARPPFRAESIVETLQQVIHNEPAAPRLLNPDVPLDLETISLKCLEKEPHRRYATAEQLADDLGRFLNGEPITARPISRPARLARWCRRNPLVAALTSTAAALLITVAVGAMIAFLREANMTSEITRAYGDVKQLRTTEQQLRTDVTSAEQQLAQAQQKTSSLEGNYEVLETQRRKLALVLETRQQKLYSTLLFLAQADWEAGEVVRAVGYLDDCPVHLRDRRWERLKHLCQPRMRTFAGTHRLAISADGRWLATVRSLPDVIPPAKTNVAAVPGEKPPAGPLDPRPSMGTGAETDITFINRTAGEIKLVWIDSGNTRHSYRVIEANDRHEQHTYAGHVWLVTNAAGRQLTVVEAVAGGREVIVDQIAKETPPKKKLPQQEQQAAAPRYEIVIWDFQTEKLVRAIPSRAAVECLAFHPQGRMLLVGNEEGAVQCWDIVSGLLLHTLQEHSAPVTSLSMSADGRRLASASHRQVQYHSEGEILLWDLDTFTFQRKLSGSRFVALDPAGEQVSFSTLEGRPANGRSNLHSIVRIEPFTASADLPADVVRIDGGGPYTFSPDGSQLAISGDGGDIEVWNVASKQRLFEFRVYGHSHVAFSPDGTRLAYAVRGNSSIKDRSADSLVVRNLNTGERERMLPWYDSPISAVAFTPDGQGLATTDGRIVKVWDVAPPADPTEEILADIRQLKVKSRDWPQWGGSRSRVNTPAGERIPASFDVGKFDRKTGKHSGGRNLKWVANLGSQTFGNPVVANGKVFVGTNNGAAYLKRYPADIDLGVLLCFEEKTGQFLWQHSNEKLPTGRVHDWPLQGVCSTPAVDGDRLWYVTNRGEVVCLDTAGFADGEDDAPLQGVRQPLFELTANLGLLSELDARQASAIHLLTLQTLLTTMKLPLPAYFNLQKRTDKLAWDVKAFDQATRTQTTYATAEIDGDELRVWNEAGEAANQLLGSLPIDLTAGLNDGVANKTIRELLAAKGLDTAGELTVETKVRDQSWRLILPPSERSIDKGAREVTLQVIKGRLVCDMPIAMLDQEADVVWSLNMMRELGVSPHNMSNCSPLIVGDWLFVCTSNGVAEDHLTIPAPDAPSFICLNRWTGKLLWSDKSPGRNIQHAQWASASYGTFAGQPQVIFPGGDGWVYGFDPSGDGQGNSKLLWKFDANFKESVQELGGRGTRNEVIAFPAIYDGLVYLVTGQDPEHGEGGGCLWCIDPARFTRGEDISESLAVDKNGQPIPYKPIQAVVAALGEHSIANPQSAVVWRYTAQDRNGDGVVDFDEQFHRSLSVPVIKDDILYVSDFSGLFHCLNAKSGKAYWTYDMLAASWNSALLVDGKVFIGDEDGDLAIFRHSADPTKGMRLEDGGPMPWFGEINMSTAIYMAPIVANNVLYVATKDRLFAIAQE